MLNSNKFLNCMSTIILEIKVSLDPRKKNNKSVGYCDIAIQVAA